MPLHDWSRVDHGLFHDFHNSWLYILKDTLNHGVLPAGYYALTDQHSEGYISDVLTYGERRPTKGKPKSKGGPAVALAEPGTEDRMVSKRRVVYPGRRLAIRREGETRVVAVIEVVSPSNKDRLQSVGIFTGKVLEFLSSGIHVLVVDILPPNSATPHGMHSAIWSVVDPERMTPHLPPDRPMVVAGYRAEPKPVAYLNYAAVGRPIPAGPLYLDRERFVEVPLEATYTQTFDRQPEQFKASVRR